MAEYLIEYIDKADRLAKIEYQEKTLKRQMLHDNFTSTGGVMTFIDPIPPTPEQIAEQLAEKIESEAMAKADTLIDAISNLADAKVFLKRLCARLIKKGILP